MTLGLSETTLRLIRTALGTHESVTGALIFGSRAKGSAHPASDIDIAVEGAMDAIEAARIAATLDDLPLPYRFDVKAIVSITNPALKEHVARVGVRIV